MHTKHFEGLEAAENLYIILVWYDIIHVKALIYS